MFAYALDSNEVKQSLKQLNAYNQVYKEAYDDIIDLMEEEKSLHHSGSPLDSKNSDDGRFQGLYDKVSQIIEMLRARLKSSENSAKTLKFALKNMMDYACVRMGSFIKNKSLFPLAKAVEKVISLQQEQADAKSIRLGMDLKGCQRDTLIYCDESRLMQVILCLQSNAIKFTDRGFVRILAQLENISSHLDNITITVQDSGIGLRPREKERILSI